MTSSRLADGGETPRTQYEAEVISLFRGFARPVRSGISDEQYALEIALGQRLRAAITEMHAAIEQVNADSGFRTINVTAWTDFVHDEFPNLESWQSRIDEVRNGY